LERAVRSTACFWSIPAKPEENLQWLAVPPAKTKSSDGVDAPAAWLNRVASSAFATCRRRARELASVGRCRTISTTPHWRAGLYPVPTITAKDWRSLPDWPAIHRELRRKGLTLQLVWEEYRAAYPDGYGRSWFCELYRAWEGRLSPTMRQAPVAGEKLFVGATIDIVDAAIRKVTCCPATVSHHGIDDDVWLTQETTPIQPAQRPLTQNI
jgi:hypothetical protein